MSRRLEPLGSWAKNAFGLMSPGFRGICSLLDGMIHLNPKDSMVTVLY